MTMEFDPDAQLNMLEEHISIYSDEVLWIYFLLYLQECLKVR